MATIVKIEGLKELDKALAQLPKATGKGVLRRVLKRRAQPVADTASAMASRRTGALAESAAVGTQLTKRQKALHKKMFRNDKASVELFAGFGGLAQATQQEFGNENHGPQPAMRPAWDATKGAMLDGIKDDLWDEIKKSADRFAKRAAKIKG